MMQIKMVSPYQSHRRYIRLASTSLPLYIYIFYARYDRASYLFLILKQELFAYTKFFSLCMCVLLAQRSIYEAFFRVWEESARYGFQWLCGLLGLYTVAFCSSSFYYYITCHIPSFLKTFSFFPLCSSIPFVFWLLNAY